jgi:hypothetical protein
MVRSRHKKIDRFQDAPVSSSQSNPRQLAPLPLCDELFSRCLAGKAATKCENQSQRLQSLIPSYSRWWRHRPDSSAHRTDCLFAGKLNRTCDETQFLPTLMMGVPQGCRAAWCCISQPYLDVRPILQLGNDLQHYLTLPTLNQINGTLPIKLLVRRKQPKIGVGRCVKLGELRDKPPQLEEHITRVRLRFADAASPTRYCFWSCV